MSNIIEMEEVILNVGPMALKRKLDKLIKENENLGTPTEINYNDEFLYMAYVSI